MTGGGRRRPPDGESFADVAGDDVVPLSGREKLCSRPHLTPNPVSRRREPVRFVCDGAGRGRAEDVAARALSKLRRGEPAPELEIDLHGLSARGAEARVRRDLASARDRGLRCVLVIHGRGHHSAGDAVLRRSLSKWLTHPPLDRFVQAFTGAPERLGGSGASLVLLRRERERGR